MSSCYLMYLQETSSPEEFLLLVAFQGFGASDHFGMPAWEPRVRAAMDRRRGQDPAFVERLRTVYEIDFSEILKQAPANVPICPRWNELS
ncbi:hypothetical protein [Streptomyces sp. NPDC008240]|uniref:hypothetical protein n=1 Tax=Streptomyces sp. NPDC008240 TaxID=3364822 RepID=UPI0036F083F2